ncbi:MAG: class I SAM-dependent methyltransferase [Mycobacterium sp.]
MSEAMEAEFDTVAEWTAQVAAEFGPEFHMPAACRGSGSPAAMDWLVEHMALQPRHTLLDSGAGVGGPAAYAAQARGVLPVLIDPEKGACRAARRLFDYPVMQASGSALPVHDASFDAAWALGVLCTTSDQFDLLDELRRVVRPAGRIGLLVFVAHRAIPRDQLQDNNFPTNDRLSQLVREACLKIEHRVSTAELPPTPQAWSDREETVDEALAKRYGHTRVWQLAERQSADIGRLLGDGTLTGELLVLRHA